MNNNHTRLYCQGTYEELLLLTEIFLDRAYALPSSVKSSINCIVDGGANVGFTSVFYALMYPQAKIYAFEPEPATFSLLQKNTTDPAMSNISTFQIALSDKKGTLDFFVHPTKNISSSLVQRDSSYSKVQVSSMSLDDVFDLIHSKNIDVLKLDVEGAEFKIFETTNKLPQIGFITAEIHADITNKHPDEIVKKLELTHDVILNQLTHTNRFLCQATLRTQKDK